MSTDRATSYEYGKAEVCSWIRERFPVDAEILDVGAGSGTWRALLPEYEKMDAVEVFRPNVEKLKGYRLKFFADIRGFCYDRYDLIIFGDVLEHLTVEAAQTALAYAAPRCRDMIVAVPFLYPQEPVGGNPYERHVQDDLTAELFAKRYPSLEVLFDTGKQYCYYHKT